MVVWDQKLLMNVQKLELTWLSLAQLLSRILILPRSLLTWERLLTNRFPYTAHRFSFSIESKWNIFLSSNMMLKSLIVTNAFVYKIKMFMQLASHVFHNSYILFFLSCIDLASLKAQNFSSIYAFFFFLNL